MECGITFSDDTASGEAALTDAVLSVLQSVLPLF
jgi:hypothetical protein